MEIMNYTSTMQTKTNGCSLPEGWQWVKLGDVCEINPRRPALERADSTLTTFVQMSAVDDLLGVIARPEQKPFSEIRKGYTYFAEDDVIFAKITPCMENGKHAIARNLIDGIGFGSTEFHVIRPNEDIIAEWIWHFVRQPYVRQNAMSYFTGAVGQQRVPDSFLKSLQIPLPPLDEQRRIAIRLTEQLAGVESVRKAAEEQLHAAWQLPSAYLQELFGDSAKHKWNWQRLGDVCELLPSNTIKSIGDTVVTAITTACLSENGFLPAGLKISRMDAKDAKQALVREGEILIARSNTPDLVGRVSMYPGDPPNVVASDLTIRIWASSACHPPFLTAYLSYLYLSGYWKEMAGGASGSMKKITRTQVLDVKIPVPDVDTQRKIVAEMQGKMDHYRELEQSLESQLAEINRLPASLLREAFAGRL